jgi:hypothetical protein
VLPTNQSLADILRNNRFCQSMLSKTFAQQAQVPTTFPAVYHPMLDGIGPTFCQVNVRIKFVLSKT